MIKGQITYAGATDTPDYYPAHPLQEIAFTGASNVGKSSLINALVGHSSIARTSKTPGCTQKIHFFNWADRVMITDLPGYGYAKTSKSMQKSWQRLMDDYLGSRAELRVIFALMDARHAPKKTDHAFLSYLQDLERPFIPVLTKCDKIKAGRRKELEGLLREIHQSYVGCFPLAIFTSSEKKNGMDALNWMMEWMLSGALDMPQEHDFVKRSNDIVVLG